MGGKRGWDVGWLQGELETGQNSKRDCEPKWLPRRLRLWDYMLAACRC